jgi:hypothetical protein
MTLLESREREALTLRFVQEWEYHQIAAAKSDPDRDGPVASFQRQEKAGRTPEGIFEIIATGRTRLILYERRSDVVGQGGEGGQGRH